MLKVNNISKSFSGIKALQDFSFRVDQGQIVGIIGPNGAGKSTVFNVLSGVYPTDSGEIEFCGEVISTLQQYEITRKGIARTFQNIRLFTGMNVLENIMTAHDECEKYSFWEAVLQLPRKLRRERQNEKFCYHLLEMMGIERFALHKVDSLPYGTQRLVEICRALATGPKLLLLDEPAAGLNPNEVQDFNQIVRRIRDEMQISILIIEHHMDVIMELCDHIYVLNFGKKLAEGSAKEITENQDVVVAYMGEAD